MATRKIVEINEELCDGCGQCVLSCAEGAIEVIDGKARIVKDSYCDGLGACLGECPQGALTIIEREAEEFDPEAVEEYLKEKEQRQKAAESPMPCGCPSSQIQMFEASCKQADEPARHTGGRSALSHWPVQIRLVPAKAPFLRGAHLLVAADCAPVAYPNFHRDFVEGRVVLLGCPKFDDAREYVEKFAEIFRIANVQSVTVLDMEVPCCSALPAIVQKGMEASAKSIPMEEVTVSVRGEVLKRRQSAA
ncbi:ATP-binding protein [Desulfoferrobacter suflitae]|uniref:ATP-binding protein n=1 Tax=Desulfoferrobacter suflitae TaxID=2865782 RepID=UPI00216449F8|nr:4Fe-4S binding protein [Desulfoferrobacter suflitae]MCK8600431.1 4Fe-4S binding protein [Desulfoferrobacter suflitae]